MLLQNFLKNESNTEFQNASVVKVYKTKAGKRSRLATIAMPAVSVQ